MPGSLKSPLFLRTSIDQEYSWTRWPTLCFHPNLRAPAQTLSSQRAVPHLQQAHNPPLPKQIAKGLSGSWKTTSPSGSPRAKVPEGLYSSSVALVKPWLPTAARAMWVPCFPCVSPGGGRSARRAAKHPQHCPQRAAWLIRGGKGIAPSAELGTEASSHTLTLKLCPEERSGQSTSQGFTLKSLFPHNTEKGLWPKTLLG